MNINVRVDNEAIEVSHYPLTKLRPVARVTADAPSGATTLSVDNANEHAFVPNDFVVVGKWGTPTADIAKVASVTASSVTFTAGLPHAHSVDETLVVTLYDEVELSRAATPGGLKTVIETLPIYPNQFATAYADQTFSDGYAFARFHSSETGLFSNYSDAVPYSGNPLNSAEKVIFGALSLTGDYLNEDYTQEHDLIRDVNEAQQHVTKLRDWSFELWDDEALTTVEGEVSYSLSLLTHPPKYADTKRSFISVRAGNYPLRYASLREFEAHLGDARQTTLAAAAASGATSVTLANARSFADQGSVLLRGNGHVSYAAKDNETGVLSGISGSAIAEEVPEGATVWQNFNGSDPSHFTVYNGALMIAHPPRAASAGLPVKLRYLRVLPELTSFSSLVSVPFPEVLQHYVAHKIFLRKRMAAEAQASLDLFAAWLAKSVNLYEFRPVVAQQVYRLGSTSSSSSDFTGWYG